MEINEEQKAILKTVSDDKVRFVNVYAGPGSGKSTIIAGLISEFIDVRKYSLEDFLCLSFTNESWKELRDKIIEKCDNIPSKQFEKLTITTFHKYCAVLCQKDKDYRKEINKKLINLTSKEEKSQKNEQLNELISNAADTLDEYLKANSQDNIQINKDVLKKKVLFLDEAQDLTQDIYEFVCSLMSAVRYVTEIDLKVYAFSDPDQSIFEYDGADSEYIKDLMKFSPKLGKETEKKLCDVKNLFLTSNFRSNEEIVGFTEDYRNLVLPDSPRKKRMKSNKGKGQKKSIQFYKVKDDAYCNAIVDAVKDKIGNEKIKSGSTIGIIVPKNYESYNIYEILKKEYLDNLNITVKTTGNSATSFKLIRLDEFHSLIRIFYEALGVFSPYYKSGKAIISLTRNENHNSPMIPMDDVCLEFYGDSKKDAEEYNLKKCIEKFAEAYEKSKYKDAVIEFFDEFRKGYEGIEYYDLVRGKDIINNGKNRAFDQTELDKFIELLYNYTFDEFCCDFVDNKRTFQNDTPQIEIMVSTIHKAKGHEFDYVFMACLDKDREWLNKKDANGFEKCRYVSMTRAKSNLYIFNDKNEEKYFCPVSDKEMIDMTNIEKSPEESVFLSCGDMVLSFLQYCGNWRVFTQFAPSNEKENECVMFPDTPEWLQAGRKLKLENVMSSESENNRFVFIADDSDKYSFAVERLAKPCWEKYASYKGKENETKTALDDSIICRIVKAFENYRDTYKSEQADSEKSLLEGQREKISKNFADWCKDHLEIEIGAVVVVNEVNAPWIEGVYSEDKLQYYKYYSSEGALRKDEVKDTVIDQLKYYKFNKSESCFDYFDINNVISETEKNKRIMEEMGKVLEKDIILFFNKTLRFDYRLGPNYDKRLDELKNGEYKAEWKECADKVEKELKSDLKKQIIENAERQGFSRRVILPKIKFKADNKA